jgi:hypothetical protein
MRIPTRRRFLVVGSSLALALGLVSPASPAQAAVTITTDEVNGFQQLWSQGSGPFVPALSAGPEVGWNAGLESLRPPGANYYRLWDMKVAWRDVNPAPGVFDWSILDRRIAQVEAWGGKPIMVLGLTPQWAAADPTAGDPRWGAGTASPPADMNTWRSYVRAVVQRYGARIGAYETWNEANLKTFWTGSSAQMAEMVGIATEEIGESAIALGPSVTTRLASGRTFIEELVDSLTPATMAALDAWSIHTYPAAYAGPTVAQACERRVGDVIRWQRALLRVGEASKKNVIKPLWDTEVNFGLAGPGPRPKTAWSDTDGAALLMCSYQDSRALGIAVTAWYEFTAAEYDLLGVQMNPGTPAINAAWAALPGVVGTTNPWIPDLSKAIEKTIVIEGQRKTISGKPGFRVKGATSGFAEGERLSAWIRFPGMTSYFDAATRPVVKADGSVVFRRRTGKRTYFFLGSADGRVKSNRIIIPAK